jgi:hypothetical protein
MPSQAKSWKRDKRGEKDATGRSQASFFELPADDLKLSG